MEKCYLCPRMCGVNRKKGEIGFCSMPEELFVARAALHMWEEPCISGEEGSGTVFFSGCNLKCVFCQNYAISGGETGKKISVERLAEIFLELQDKGANNINLVTGVHYADKIIRALDAAKTKGLSVPVVYNSSGYENIETLKMLENYIDIYLPDFKYIERETALKYSKAADYPDVAKKAINEMIMQKPKVVFNERGIVKSGVIIRHMLLPSYSEESKKIIKYIFDNYGNSVFMSIMNQYTPIEKLKLFPEISRRVTEEEYDSVIDYAISIGVENAYVQEGETQTESFIPNFDCEGV